MEENKTSTLADWSKTKFGHTAYNLRDTAKLLYACNELGCQS